MPNIDIGDTHLRVKIRGEGPPAFVIHGGPGLSHHYMAAGFKPLERHMTCHYIDLTGHGKSSRIPQDQLTHSRWTGDLERLRKVLGFEQVALVGHSYGGFISLEYATRHPRNVSHLILVDTGARMTDFARVVENVRARRHDLAEAGRIFLDEGYRDDDEMRSWLMSVLPLYFLREPSAAAIKGLSAMHFDAVAGARFSVLTQTYDVRARLGKITCPTIVLCGRHDFILPPDINQEVADGIAGSTFEVFEDSGHFPFWEEPNAFWATLDAWLEAHPAVMVA